MTQDGLQPRERTRVCYYMQTHKGPEQIARLVRIIKQGSPGSIVLIDHDVSGERLDPALFSDLSDVYSIGTSGGYGDFSHIDRLLAAVDWLDDHGMQFDWLQNLTGQDYPLRPIADIEQAISAGGFDGYMQYAPVFPERTPADADWGAGPAYRLCTPFDSAMRFDYSHRRFGMPSELKQRLLRPFMVVNYLQSWFTISLAFSSAGWRRKTTIFNDDFILYGGSFFCALSASCLRYVRDYAVANPDIVQYFRTMAGPDELFFQTVLINSGKFRISPAGTHYVYFPGGKYNHPKTLDESDLPMMIGSGAHWARKFDSGAEVLAVLDRRVRPDAVPPRPDKAGCATGSFVHVQLLEADSPDAGMLQA
jgi:hypothetical protein